MSKNPIGLESTGVVIETDNDRVRLSWKDTGTVVIKDRSPIKPYVRSDLSSKHAGSFRVQGLVINYIISSDLVEDIRSTEVMKERAVSGIHDIVEVLVGNLSVLHEVSNEIGTKYSYIERAIGSIEFRHFSSLGSIDTTDSESGLGMFEGFIGSDTKDPNVLASVIRTVSSISASSGIVLSVSILQ